VTAAEAPHCASALQPEGQLAEAPPHRYGAQGGLPAAPAPKSLQTPTEPERLHASQAPEQAVSQQVPSAQLPLTHSGAARQALPLAFLARQVPPLHQKPVAQPAPVVHPVLQAGAAPSHLNGEHDGAPAPPAGTRLQVPTLPARLQERHD